MLQDAVEEQQSTADLPHMMTYKGGGEGIALMNFSESQLSSFKQIINSTVPNNSYVCVWVYLRCTLTLVL